jgi:hypothetical protein
VPDFCRQPTRVFTSIYEFHLDRSDTAIAIGDATIERSDHHYNTARNDRSDDHHHDSTHPDAVHYDTDHGSLR